MASLQVGLAKINAGSSGYLTENAAKGIIPVSDQRNASLPTAEHAASKGFTASDAANAVQAAVLKAESKLPPNVADRPDPHEADTGKIPVTSGPSAAASLPPDAQIVDPVERATILQSAKQKASDVLDNVILRKPPTIEGEKGQIDIAGNLQSAVGLNYLFGGQGGGGSRGAIENAKDQEIRFLGQAFQPDRLERLGRELGGTPARETTLGDIPFIGDNLGPFKEFGGVVPGTKLLEGIFNDNSAVRKGFDLQKDLAVNAAKKGYLNQDQAVNIGGALVNKGYSEERVKNLVSNISGLRTGVTANLSDENFADAFDQFERSGVGTIDELRGMLNGLEGGANAARMSVNQFYKDSVQFADQMESMGGNRISGIRTAKGFAAITGAAPQVAGALATNPAIQGAIYGETGIMPDIQALAGPAALAGASIKTLRQQRDAFARGLQDKVINVKGGTKVLTAEDQANAKTAVFNNLPADEVQRLLSQDGEEIEARATAIDQISAYQQKVDAVTEGTEKGSTARKYGLDQLNTGMGLPGDVVTRDEIMETLKSSGIDNSKLEELGKLQGEEFATSATEAVGSVFDDRAKEKLADNESMFDTKVDINVSASPLLEKYFNVENNVTRSRRDRDAGDGDFLSSVGNRLGQVPDRFGDVIKSFGL